MTTNEPTLAQQFGITGADAQRLSELGCDLIDSGDLEGAASIFSGLLVLNPYDANSRAAYGSVLERLERFTEAERAYSEAIETDAACELARLNRGVMRLRRNDRSGADDLRAIASKTSKVAVEARRLLSAATAPSR